MHRDTGDFGAPDPVWLVATFLSRYGYILCCRFFLLVLGSWQTGTNRIKQISRRTRFCPHAWFSRFSYRAICRDPRISVCQELLINNCHEPQGVNTLAFWLIVQIGPRQRQQRTLPTDTQLMILTHHFCLTSWAVEPRRRPKNPVLQQAA